MRIFLYNPTKELQYGCANFAFIEIIMCDFLFNAQIARCAALTLSLLSTSVVKYFPSPCPRIILAMGQKLFCYIGSEGIFFVFYFIKK